KEAERLRFHSQRLAELESTKTEFLNLASHELRGPLAVARGYITMLEDGSLTPEQFAERAGVVAVKLAQIESLVQKMLETARLEQGELVLKSQKLDVADLIQEQVHAFEAFLDEAHSLQVNLSPDLPEIEGDRDRLGAVVQNLLDNAAKYSPAGGRIEVRVAASREHLFI